MLGGFNQSGFLNFNVFEYELSEPKNRPKKKTSFEDEQNRQVTVSSTKGGSEFRLHMTNLTYSNFVTNQAS